MLYKIELMVVATLGHRSAVVARAMAYACGLISTRIRHIVHSFFRSGGAYATNYGGPFASLIRDYKRVYTRTD